MTSFAVLCQTCFGLEECSSLYRPVCDNGYCSYGNICIFQHMLDIRKGIEAFYINAGLHLKLSLFIVTAYSEN